MKIAIVVGTRPEIIKMSSIIKECQKREIPFILIHSNQHYSPEMDSMIFEDLDLPKPHYSLGIGTTAIYGNQIGNILIKIEDVLKEERPDVLLVQGDTNTVSASALAASHLGIPVGHVEAGLRSYDRTMPEELNRVVTDHLSDYLFAVSQKQKENLLSEGIDPTKIHTVGNTVADALLGNVDKAKKVKIFDEAFTGYADKKAILFTCHRAGNVDNKAALKEILDGVEMMREACPDSPFVFPIHPRTLKKIKEFDFKVPEYVINPGPLGYLEFLSVMLNSKVIVTDSGGLQEEACILGIPCVTIRENTERPETLDVGSNKLVGRDINLWKEAFVEALEDKERNWKSPFGDGDSAEKIIDALIGKSASKTTSKEKGKKITVVGLGYMGLPIACLLSNGNNIVTGYDINQARISDINEGVVPFQEKGFEEVFKTAKANGFSAQAEIKESDVYFIAVPTPAQKGQCDLSAVIAAVKEVSKVATDDSLIILESTIPPGTCEDVVEPIFKEKGINPKLVFCPERAIPGNTIYELVHNDRVLGGRDKEAILAAESVYLSFVTGEIHHTSFKSAETAKLLENTFRDVNIAFANSVYRISKEIGFDFKEAIRLANCHPRVNILEPGVGVGGHCIAVDPWFLIQGVNSDSAKVIQSSRELNDSQPKFIADEIASYCKEAHLNKVGILGLSYKPNVDDLRESPSLELVSELKGLGFDVESFDPHAVEAGTMGSLNEISDWADVLIVATKHKEFLENQLPKIKFFV